MKQSNSLIHCPLQSGVWEEPRGRSGVSATLCSIHSYPERPCAGQHGMDVEAKLAALSPDWSPRLLFLFYQQNRTVLFPVRLLLACFQQQQYCSSQNFCPPWYLTRRVEPLLVQRARARTNTHHYPGTRDIGYTVL